jgi:hypothetical protein
MKKLIKTIILFSIIIGGFFSFLKAAATTIIYDEESREFSGPQITRFTEMCNVYADSLANQNIHAVSKLRPVVVGLSPELNQSLVYYCHKKAQELGEMSYVFRNLPNILQKGLSLIKQYPGDFQLNISTEELGDPADRAFIGWGSFLKGADQELRDAFNSYSSNLSSYSSALLKIELTYEFGQKVDYITKLISVENGLAEVLGRLNTEYQQRRAEIESNDIPNNFFEILEGYQNQRKVEIVGSLMLMQLFTEWEKRQHAGEAESKNQDYE